VVTLCTTSFKIPTLQDRDGHTVDGYLPFDSGSVLIYVLQFMGGLSRPTALRLTAFFFGSTYL